MFFGILLKVLAQLINFKKLPSDCTYPLSELLHHFQSYQPSEVKLLLSASSFMNSDQIVGKENTGSTLSTESSQLIS
jgi:hypothetical protein